MSASQCGDCLEVYDPELGHRCWRYAVGGRYWPDGHARPTDEQVKSSLASREHLWGVWVADVTWESCCLCGAVKRADGKNKPCEGPIGVVTR